MSVTDINPAWLKAARSPQTYWDFLLTTVKFRYHSVSLTGQKWLQAPALLTRFLFIYCEGEENFRASPANIPTSMAVLTCLAELRGAPAAPRWEDGNDALAEARASLLDAAAQTPERRVRLAAVGVFHAVDLTAHAGALHHVAACCAHGPAEHAPPSPIS